MKGVGKHRELRWWCGDLPKAPAESQASKFLGIEKPAYHGRAQCGRVQASGGPGERRMDVNVRPAAFASDAGNQLLRVQKPYIGSGTQ